MCDESPTEGAILGQSILDQWCRLSPNGNRVRENFSLEHFLERSLIDEILYRMSDIESQLIDGDIDLFERECQRIWREYLLRGGLIHVHPQNLGYAVDTPKFKDWILSHTTQGIAITEDDVDYFIEALCNPNNEDLEIYLINETISNLRIKKYNLWVTWDNDHSDPFCFRSSTSRASSEVRFYLALASPSERRFAEEDLMIIVFPKENINVFRPTVADSQINSFFQPPERNFDLHGMTNPCHPTIQSIYKKSGLICKGRRPEGLCEPFEIRHVVNNIVNNNGRCEVLKYE